MEQGGLSPAQFMSFPSNLDAAILKLLHQILSLSFLTNTWHPTSYWETHWLEVTWTEFAESLSVVLEKEIATHSSILAWIIP